MILCSGFAYKIVLTPLQDTDLMLEDFVLNNVLPLTLLLFQPEIVLPTAVAACMEIQLIEPAKTVLLNVRHVFHLQIV